MLDRSTALDVLRASALRVTPQRRALVDALVDNRTHPTAEAIAREVAARLPGVSLTTVYKGLHEFAELGLVRELDLPGSMRFDPDASPHAHLVCSECGDVVDVALPESLLGPDSLPVPDGVRVDRVEITLTGSCASCGAHRH